MKDPDDFIAYRKSIEWLRFHIFLPGLDKEFDQIQREILQRDLLPNLEECYSLVQQEAIRRTTLKGDSGAPESSAMVAQNQSTQSQQDRARPNNSID